MTVAHVTTPAEMFTTDAPVETGTIVPAVKPSIVEESEHIPVPEPTASEALSAASIIGESLHPPPENTASVVETPAPEVSIAVVENPRTTVRVSPNNFAQQEKQAQDQPADNSALVDSESDPVISSLLEEVEASTQSIPAPETPTPTPLIVEAEEHLPRSVDDPAQPLTSNPDDLSDFYAALGLDDELKDAIHSEQAPAEMNSAVENEAERQRQAELHVKQIAEKRADIESRHTEWEKKLEALIASESQRIRKVVHDLRDGAAKDLEENQDFKKREDKLVQEAEKFLKGVEVYFKTLTTEKRKPEEKRAMWSKVVEKVEEKWKESLNDYQKYVHEWYVDTVNKETQEVRLSFNPLKLLSTTFRCTTLWRS
jgi:hypothetical protein